MSGYVEEHAEISSSFTCTSSSLYGNLHSTPLSLREDQRLGGQKASRHWWNNEGVRATKFACGASFPQRLLQTNEVPQGCTSRVKTTLGVTNMTLYHISEIPFGDIIRTTSRNWTTSAM